MTHTRTALVATDAPARYAKQLASHLGRKMTVTETDGGPELSMTFDEGAATCLIDTSVADLLRLEVTGTTQAQCSGSPASSARTWSVSAPGRASRSTGPPDRARAQRKPCRASGPMSSRSS